MDGYRLYTVSDGSTGPLFLGLKMIFLEGKYNSVEDKTFDEKSRDRTRNMKDQNSSKAGQSCILDMETPVYNILEQNTRETIA